MDAIDVGEQHGSDLSSRFYAAKFRAEIVRAVSRGDTPVVLDFAQVRTVSDGWADEVFGIIANHLGEEWFKTNLLLLNLGEYVREVILDAIAARIPG